MAEDALKKVSGINNVTDAEFKTVKKAKTLDGKECYIFDEDDGSMTMLSQEQFSIFANKYGNPLEKNNSVALEHKKETTGNVQTKAAKVTAKKTAEKPAKAKETEKPAEEKKEEEIKLLKNIDTTKFTQEDKAKFDKLLKDAADLNLVASGDILEMPDNATSDEKQKVKEHNDKVFLDAVKNMSVADLKTTIEAYKNEDDGENIVDTFKALHDFLLEKESAKAFADMSGENDSTGTKIKKTIDKGIKAIADTPAGKYLKTANKRVETLLERPFGTDEGDQVMGENYLMAVGTVAAQATDLGHQILKNTSEVMETLDEAATLEKGKVETSLDKAAQNGAELVNGVNPLDAVAGASKIVSGTLRGVSHFLKGGSLANDAVKASTEESLTLLAREGNEVTPENIENTKHSTKGDGNLTSEEQIALNYDASAKKIIKQSSELVINDKKEAKQELKEGAELLEKGVKEAIATPAAVTDGVKNLTEAGKEAITIESKNTGAQMVNGVVVKGVGGAVTGTLSAGSGALKTVGGVAQGIVGGLTYFFDDGKRLEEAGETLKSAGNDFADAGKDVTGSVANLASAGYAEADKQTSETKSMWNPLNWFDDAEEEVEAKATEKSAKKDDRGLGEKLTQQAFNGVVDLKENENTADVRKKWAKDATESYQAKVNAEIDKKVAAEVENAKANGLPMTEEDIKLRKANLQEAHKKMDKLVDFATKADKIIKDDKMTKEEKGAAFLALVKESPEGMHLLKGFDQLIVNNLTKHAENADEHGVANEVLDHFDGYVTVTDGKNDGKIGAWEVTKNITIGVYSYPVKLVKNQFVSTADRAIVGTVGCSEIAEMSIGALNLVKKAYEAGTQLSKEDDIYVKDACRKIGEVLVEGCSFAERIAALCGYRDCIWHHDHTPHHNNVPQAKPVTPTPTPKTPCEKLIEEPWNLEVPE